MPAFDPQFAKFLEVARQAGRMPFQALPPKQARDNYAASWDALQAPAQNIASVQDLQIPTAAGPLALRIYRGLGTDLHTPLPCLLFLHGGGWVIGNLESHDRLCRSLANRAQICVVAVDYRLAPEHPYPAAVEDSAEALRWLTRHAAELPIDAQRIGVGGDSAGGNLAAVLALMSRDGALPALKLQALLYPVVDLTASSDSYRRIQSGVLLTAAAMHYFIGHYTPQASQRTEWQASPLLAQSLAGTAPAFVLTVAHDPLCDEGRAYATRLEDEGVRVQALHLSDQIHGMLMQGRVVAASETVGLVVADWVGAMLRAQ